MCNIAVLKAGVSIPLDKLTNCVYNNPHSFGLVLRDKNHKKLQVIRKCPSGGNDPQEIFDLLEKHKDIDRFLHLRWKTEGPIDLANAHPFTAFKSDKRQVEFMHNGTLYEYRPKTTTTYEGGRQTTNYLEPNVSDSKKFNDELLAPLLAITSGAHGPADISDPTFQKIIDKFWSGQSRGILICNDLEPVLLNAKDWKELDFGGGKFWSSNNEYWEKLTRGPVFDKQEEERKQKEEAARRASFQEPGGRTYGRNVTNLKDVDLAPRLIPSEDLANIFEDFNIWTEEGMASLCNLTEVELLTFVQKNQHSATDLLIHLTSNFDELYKRKERMVKYIKELKQNGKTTFDKKDEQELGERAAA